MWWTDKPKLSDLPNISKYSQIIKLNQVPPYCLPAVMARSFYSQLN